MISIFNNTVSRFNKKPRYYSLQNQITANHENSIKLLVSMFTNQPLTKYYDYVQLYYHGGGIYTAVTFVFTDSTSSISVFGQLLDMLKDHETHTRKKNKMNILQNPLNDEDVCINLRIKTIGTFALNDDSMFRSQLVDERYTTIKYNNKPVQLIDARHGTEVSEMGLWHSPIEQFTEVRVEPNGDFIGTLMTQFNQEIDSRFKPSKAEVVKQVVTDLLPNLQFQLYNERIAPYIN